MGQGHEENIANLASSLNGAEPYQSLRRRNWNVRERGGHIVHERSRRHEMSPEGNGEIGSISAPWDDAPQNNNAFGGASNDIPPEYANDPEMWQAI